MPQSERITKRLLRQDTKRKSFEHFITKKHTRKYSYEREITEVHLKKNIGLRAMKFSQRCIKIILNSIQRGDRLIPSITVVFIIIATVGVIATLFTWLYRMLVGEKFWWLSKEKIMQIHAYISGLLNGWSSLGLILLLRYYFYSRHNSN